MGKPRKYAGPLQPGKKSAKVPKGSKEKSLTKKIENVSLKQCETKQSNQYTSSLQVLGHNTTYYAGQLLATTQGFTEGGGAAQATRNRIGNRVVAVGLRLKLYFENEAVRPNVMYRIIIFKYNTLLLAGGASITDNEFWEGPQAQGQIINRMLDKVRTKNITIIKSIVVKPTYQANYSIQTAGPVPVGPFVKTDLHSYYIPLYNKQIQYRDENSVFPTRDGYGFAVCAFDAQNTAQSTHITNLMWQSTFYFKDP